MLALSTTLPWFKPTAFGLEEIRLKPLASLNYVSNDVPILDFFLLEKSYLPLYQAFGGDQLYCQDTVFTILRRPKNKR